MSPAEELHGPPVDQIAAGEMVCLALCTEERAASLPDVPTVNECGYDIMSLGFLRQMSFMVALDGLDDAVKAKLCELFQQACQSDEYQEFAAGRSFASPPLSAMSSRILSTRRIPA